MPKYQNWTTNTNFATPSTVNASTYSLDGELVNDGVPYNTTTFITGPSSGTWGNGIYFLWDYGVGNAIVIDHMDIMLKSGSSSVTTFNYSVYGSNDGTTWTTLINASSFTSVTTSFKLYTTTTFGTTAFRYYEVIVYVASFSTTSSIVSDARLWPSNLAWTYEAGPSGAPQGVYAYSDGQGNMSINWSAVASATSYDVDVVTSSGTETFASPVGTGITSTHYSYTGGTIGNMYYAKVRAWVSGSPGTGSQEVGVILGTDKITADMTGRMTWTGSSTISGTLNGMMKFTDTFQDSFPTTPNLPIYIITQDNVLIPFSGGSSRPQDGWMWPRTAPGRT